MDFESLQNYAREHPLLAGLTSALAGLVVYKIVTSFTSAGPKLKRGKLPEPEGGDTSGVNGGVFGEGPEAIAKLEGKVPVIGQAFDLIDQKVGYIGAVQNMINKLDPKTGLGYYVGFDGNAVVILIRPDHIKKVMNSQVVHMLHGLKPASEAFFGKKVLFVLEGKQWLGLRNLMKKAFLKDMVPNMVNDTAKKAKVWADILAPYAKSGKDVDMVMAASMYHLSSVSIAAFHHDLGCIERFEDGPNAVNRSFEFLLTELPRRAFAGEGTPLQCDFASDNEDNKKWSEAANAVRDVISKVVSVRIQKMEAGETTPKDMMDAMITSYWEAHAEAGFARPGLEDIMSDVGDNLVEMLFAGYNTVVNVISNGLYHVAANPEWFGHLQKEIDQVCGSRLPTMSDVPKLKKCLAVFHEALRLSPPAAIVGRQLSKDIELSGVTVPKGTEIVLPAFAVHLRKETWGEDAEEFKPNRFLEGKPYVAGSYIPFSIGPRNCMGQHFAEMEAVVAFATLFQKYTFQVPADYNHSVVFTGFGYRPFDPTNGKVGVRLIPVAR